MSKPRIKYKELYVKAYQENTKLCQEIFDLIAEKNQLIDELNKSVFTVLWETVRDFFRFEGRQEVA